MTFQNSHVDITLVVCLSGEGQGWKILCQPHLILLLLASPSSAPAPSSPPLLRPSAPGLSANCSMALCIVKLTPHISQRPCMEPRLEASSSPLAASNTTKWGETSEMLLRHRSSKHDAPQSLPLAPQHNPENPPRYATKRDATAASQLHSNQQDHSQHADANLRK